jgi:hypothetical protein
MKDLEDLILIEEPFIGRDKLSQKWSFKSEPPWKVFETSVKLSDLIPC